MSHLEALTKLFFPIDSFSVRRPASTVRSHLFRGLCRCNETYNCGHLVAIRIDPHV